MRLRLKRTPKAQTGSPTEPPVIVVGLRNPGPKYEGSRHNVGFAVVTRVASRAGQELGRAPSRVSAAVAKVGTPPQHALLVGPFSFMNESGRVVRSALDYWKVPAEDLLVVHDDIDLPFGRLRLQVGGGAGGHNGIRSVERALGTASFSRLKLGVGRPPGDMDPADYVLRGFSKSEAHEVEVMVEDAADIVEMWLSDRQRAQEAAAHRGRPA
jgi:peptidyl-tRNA hydrolase, PTH1 family